MRPALLLFLVFVSLPYLRGADDPFIPTALNAVLPKIHAGMTVSEVEAVLAPAYPGVKGRMGGWSGQSGYIEYKLDARYELSVSSFTRDGREVVHDNLLFYLYDLAIEASSGPQSLRLGEAASIQVTASPNHALQRTEAGVCVFRVCQPLPRQPLSLSLEALGPATSTAGLGGLVSGSLVPVPFVAAVEFPPTSCQQSPLARSGHPVGRLFLSGQPCAPLPLSVARPRLRRSRGPSVGGGLTTRSSEQPPALRSVPSGTLDFAGACR